MPDVTTTMLEDKLAEFRQSLQADFAGADVSSLVDRINGWRKQVMADGSFGRIMTGPQWIDQVAIRDGAINADKLAANIVIASLFTTSSTGTGARNEISATGIRQYNATNLVSELKSDGSGMLGSTDGTAAKAALAWTTTPAVTIHGTLTLGSDGKIIDADGSYWDQGGINLFSPGSAGDTINWFRTGFTSLLSIRAALATNLAQMSVLAFSDASARAASVNLTSTNNDGTTLAQLQVLQNGGGMGGQYTVGADGTHSWYVDVSAQSIQLDRTNRAMKLFGRFYPGQGTASQGTRYIDDSGTLTRINGGGLEIVTGGLTIDAGGLTVTSGNVAITNGLTVTGALDAQNTANKFTVGSNVASALPSPSKSIIFVDQSNNIRYIPVFTSASPWAA